MSPGRRRGGLAARLFAGQLLVIVAGCVTLALVALAVAPGLFRSHARQAFAVLPPGVVGHLQQAFGDALLVALAIAAATSLVTALAASWLLAQRLTGPIRSLAHAAERIGHGSHQVRVPVPATGDELAALGHAFNGMAEALESTERRRQSLLADLAHELRIPLATLAGYVEGMADGVVAADDEAWKVLDAEITRLRRLVEDLEAVSRAAEQRLALRPAPTDPGALVSAAVQAAEPAFAAKGVALHASVDHPSPSSPRTPTASARSWPTCSATPCATRPQAAGSRSPPAGVETRSSCRWPTPVRGSQRSCWSGCSSGSSAWTRPAPATAAAVGSG